MYVRITANILYTLPSGSHVAKPMRPPLRQTYPAHSPPFPQLANMTPNVETVRQNSHQDRRHSAAACACAAAIRTEAMTVQLPLRSVSQEGVMSSQCQ
jgi:hypothetical protein